MCLLIWTVFSGERCGLWASCYYLLSSFHLNTLYSKLLHIYLLFSCNNKPIFLYVVFPSFSNVFSLVSISFSLSLLSLCPFSKNLIIHLCICTSIPFNVFINIYIHIQHQPNGDGFIHKFNNLFPNPVCDPLCVCYIQCTMKLIKYCLNLRCKCQFKISRM